MFDGGTAQFVDRDQLNVTIPLRAVDDVDGLVAAASSVVRGRFVADCETTERALGLDLLVDWELAHRLKLVIRVDSAELVGNRPDLPSECSIFKAINRA